MFGWKKLAAFAGGVLFGTAGISILKSQDDEARDFSSGELQ